MNHLNPHIHGILKDLRESALMGDTQGSIDIITNVLASITFATGIYMDEKDQASINSRLEEVMLDPFKEDLSGTRMELMRASFIDVNGAPVEVPDIHNDTLMMDIPAKEDGRPNRLFLMVLTPFIIEVEEIPAKVIRKDLTPEDHKEIAKMTSIESLTDSNFMVSVTRRQWTLQPKSPEMNHRRMVMTNLGLGEDTLYQLVRLEERQNGEWFTLFGTPDKK